MQRFETWNKNSAPLQCHYVRQVLVSWTYFFKNFFAELKKDGTDYEPESLQTMLATLHEQVFSGAEWEKQLNSENMAKENK